MYPNSFEYVVAESIEDALRLLAEEEGETKLLAGGHSLLPMMKLRLVQPRRLVDIGRLAALRDIREEGSELVIGALTRHVDLAESALLRARCSVLAEAAAEIGDVQVRNRGTIGGSVAHADPGADLPVALLALDASFLLRGPSGSRRLAAPEMFVDFYTSALEPAEMLTEVRVPRLPERAGSAYRKLSHPASGYVVVSCAAVVVLGVDGRCMETRVALGGLGSVPLRAVAMEQALLGQALTAEAISSITETVADGAEPLDDLYATAEYKMHMATVVARQALVAAARPETPGRN